MPHAQGPGLSLSAREWRDFANAEAIAAWDALAQAACEPNPFYESWYLLPSLEELDSRREVTLLVLEAEDRLAGLMPLKRETSYYGYPFPHMRNWVHANCFLGQPLVAKGHERDFWKCLLDWCDRQHGLSLFLHLSHVPLAGPLHDALAAELSATGRPAATVMKEDRAMLDQAGSADDYMVQSLSTKKRKELRRQHRRLGELGHLVIDRRDDAEAVDSWADEFLALEQRGWKGASGSSLASSHETTALFTRALDGAARHGRLERLALRLDGQPIAMLASFVTPPGAYSFKTAFDEDYSRFSPGVLLQRENLATLERNAIDWVDSCAAADHPMIDHFWRERRSIGRHSIGVGGRAWRAAFRTLARRETGMAAGGIA